MGWSAFLAFPGHTHLLFETKDQVLLIGLIEILLDFSLTVKAAPHECVIRTSQP